MAQPVFGTYHTHGNGCCWQVEHLQTTEVQYYDGWPRKQVHDTIYRIIGMCYYDGQPREQVRDTIYRIIGMCYYDGQPREQVHDTIIDQWMCVCVCV